METPNELDDIIRLARFCAALYRTVPLEGSGLPAQAAELAHAAELDQWADALTVEGGGDDASPPLTARDIQVGCQLLIDVRRSPRTLDQQEVTLARQFYPEVEADSVDALESLILFYSSMLSD